jgi:adenosylcobinamide-phosphate synthase
MSIDFDALSVLIPERAGYIVIALAVDAVLGGLIAKLGWLRAESWARRITGELDRRLNRELRSERARMVRGALTITVIVGLAAGSGVGIAWLVAWLDIRSLANAILLALALGQRRLISPLARGALYLAIDQVEDARKSLQPLMGRSTSGLDQHGLARASVEAAAERLAFGVVAPVVWFMLLGLPGLFVQRAVDATDREIGYRTARHASFGLATARLNDALGLLPALLAAGLAAFAAAFVPHGTPLGAAAALYRDPWRTPGRAALWPEAAFAGALGLALGGPRQYGGDQHFSPWVNAGGRARAEAADMRRALYLFLVASLLLAGLILLVAIAVGS